MLTNLSIVLPIFALVLAGWIARKTGALGEHATREVNRLVVYLALPALLFDIMANARPAEIWQPGFIIAFTSGCAVIFGATLCWRVARGRHLADAARAHDRPAHAGGCIGGASSIGRARVVSQCLGDAEPAHLVVARRAGS